MKIKLLVMFLVAFMITSFMIQRVKAAELWIGPNFQHLSHLDAGWPYNDQAEDVVDHIGIEATLKFGMTENSYWHFGVSAGQHYIGSPCACTRNDGGAQVDTVINFGFRYRLWESQ